MPFKILVFLVDLNVSTHVKVVEYLPREVFSFIQL